MDDTALVIIARAPEPGKTKTRLARSIGNEATVLLYRAFLKDLALRFSETDAPYTLHWAYSPAYVDYNALLEELVPGKGQHMRSFPQEGQDFNTRLHHIFRWTERWGFHKTILLGSDSPHIRRQIIDEVNERLNTTDVVLGPAEDGGYYLLGMRQAHDIFSGIPMSTDVVTQMTIDAAHRQRLSVHLVEQLQDVDELPDLLKLAEILQAKPGLAPITAAHLVTHPALTKAFSRTKESV
ncbi:TIGR04282 family arsenosugar biosynthesis glycosyltransferase [Ktedonobacter racemifer]|uniref:Glycosyltransferase n=1 Tax=Ktedonobacter racemifer DSM 44963 TaxID=485913 RepID=D6TLL3_KTERA|nr:TIGR04282 family arsenosugar biosynthesis glycosyltransferase [Ktedonobacter racemifer]EFH86663.1 Protein of unknown function DUF2064 [Ktedonobacter racemifer DSM 44963]